MKFIVLFAFIGLSLAAPTSNKEDTEATIIDGSETIAEYFIPSGYDYKFRTSNSIEKSEIADLAKNLVTGEYSYISPEDNKTIKVTYTAGAGIGFFPRSDDLPAALIESIELNLKNPPEDSKKK